MEKSKNITLLDQDYLQWVKDLSTRYRRSQIKAAVKVNEEMLQFYWELGRDIVEMHVEERWGEGVMKALSTDLQKLNPTAHCFSRTNLYYVKKFYLLYFSSFEKVQQVVGQIQKGAKSVNLQQVVEKSEETARTRPTGTSWQQKRW